LVRCMIRLATARGELRVKQGCVIVSGLLVERVQRGKG
jgi:hypothetical protein